MKPTESIKFRFKKHASIGASNAEADRKFLNSCFIDNGDLKELLDLTSHRRLIIGRTGSGKSALIAQVAETADNCIALDLESLSLAYARFNTLVCRSFMGVPAKRFQGIQYHPHDPTSPDTGLQRRKLCSVM